MGFKEVNKARAVTVEINKARLWEYLYFNPEQPTDVIARVLKLTNNQMVHYLRYLYERGFIVRKKDKVDGMSRYLYSVGVEFKTPHYFIGTDNNAGVNRTAEQAQASEQARKARIIQNATRVVKLLDNPLKPAEEPKKKTKVYVGSGMSLFNNY